MIYHHVTDGVTYRSDNPLTAGLGVDIAVADLRFQLGFLRNKYELSPLAAVRQPPTGRRPRLAVTFDDAYASTARVAAPVLQELGIPWTFFVNPGLLGNHTLGFDNLVAHVVNTHGASVLQRASGLEFRGGVGEFIGMHGSRLRPRERQEVMDRVCQSLGLDPGSIAFGAQLYLTAADLVSLARDGVDIGNHTSDHVHCRTLDERDARTQIGESAETLRRMTGAPVRAFAYPYGSVTDATPVVRSEVARAGHDAAFFVHALRNRRGGSPDTGYRVALRGTDPVSLRSQLEVLPRLRAARHRVSAAVRSGRQGG